MLCKDFIGKLHKQHYTHLLHISDLPMGTAISDCLKHDQTAVHCFLTKVITLMKQKVNNIKIIHYYSDGAPSQYKNYKGLVNLYHHRLDHGINAVWNVFATSRGKSACDCIGGTVKRLVTNASLIATEKKSHSYAS